MKYIRTKDGRILKVFKDNVGLFQEDDGVTYYGKGTVDFETSYYLPKSKIIKQANTIEELCDEFIAYHKTLELTYCIKKTPFKVQDENFNIYGAIWTDKGLIYVAEMKGVLPNVEIDWRLL